MVITLREMWSIGKQSDKDKNASIMISALKFRDGNEKLSMTMA